MFQQKHKEQIYILGANVILGAADDDVDYDGDDKYDNYDCDADYDLDQDYECWVHLAKFT